MLSDEHLEELMDYEQPERFMVGNGPDKLYLTEEYSKGKRIKTLARVARRLAEGKDTLFRMERGVGGRCVLNGTHDGVTLLNGIAREFDELESLFPDNAFNTYLDLMLRHARQLPHPEYLQPSHKGMPRDLVPQTVQDLNNVVDAMRQEASSDAFKAELDARRRQCQKNRASSRKYLDAIFDMYSKVLAIRLDLTCGEETLEPRGVLASVDVEQARKQLDKFERYVREAYPRVGFLATFEYGLFTGYHFHVVVLLNGHLKHGDVWLAKQMGEHWKNVITEGRGRYFNCNAHQYRYPALGMIHRDDHMKRKAFIERVLSYLTKTDFWVKFTGAKKTFFRGLMPSKAPGKAEQVAVQAAGDEEPPVPTEG